MKVLKRNAIQLALASQHKQEIDEASELSGKVDTLRRTLADLRSQHASFVSGMKAEMERELAPLRAELDTARHEIGLAKERLAALRVPLDGEWEAVRAEKEALKKENARLDSRTLELNDFSDELDAKNEKANKYLRVATFQGYMASEDSTAAARLKTDAGHMLEKAKRESAKILEYATQVDSESAKRKRLLDYREVDLDNREKIINDRETSVSDRERSVNDKYATLERTIKRLNAEK